MALIEVILKEYKETDPEEVSLKVKGWIQRFTDEGISLYALEEILNLNPNVEVDRSMARYVTSLVELEVTPVKASDDSKKEEESTDLEKEKGIICKIASFFKLKRK